MATLRTISLDLSSNLLLKSDKISVIGFFHTKTENVDAVGAIFECGESDPTSQKSSFLQSHMRFNPHSAISIAMNPRYVQQ
jgi:hypothetical protein